MRDATLQGSFRRPHPVRMTALMAMPGLLPGPVDRCRFRMVKPFAIVIIAGLVTATLLTLAMLPALYRTIEEWHNRKASS